MREHEPARAVLDVPEQQHVDVDRARAVANAAGRTAEVTLDTLGRVQQLLGTERGPHAEGGVQEIRLVEHLPLRGGLVDRGHRLDQHLVEHERVARRPEVPQPVALVRAQAEVADPQTSFHTSTETSSTGSGIGGSGLVALTRTDSAPKRSTRRSATAAQSRSSVL
jgi:hypothetical protein